MRFILRCCVLLVGFGVLLLDGSLQAADAPKPAQSTSSGPTLHNPRVALRPGPVVRQVEQQPIVKRPVPATPLEADAAEPLLLNVSPTAERAEQKPLDGDSAAGGSADRSAAAKSARRTQTGSDGSGDAAAPDEVVQSELTPELLELRERVRRCLSTYYHRKVDAATKSPWAVMHVLIAYGVDTEILVSGREVNAIGWLCWNGACRGQRLFYTAGNGSLMARQGPGVQGHHGQFLAMLAQSKVSREYPIRVDDREFTVEDLVRYEQWTCEPRSELTFKLIGLSHYLDSDATWKNHRGETWNIERLIQEELAQPVIGAACGGTHRMMGFSYAVRRREKEGRRIEGQWQRAKTFVEDYHRYTFKLQNEDGSFSSNWFKGRGDWGGNKRRLETTGHILEWLVFSLSDDELRDPRVVKSVGYLADLLLDNQGDAWEVGPLGHGLHALAIYDERVFGGQPGQRRTMLARETRPARDAGKRRSE